MLSGKRERNQHRRTHEVQVRAAIQARIAAERAEMEARWRAAGKLKDPRHAPCKRKPTVIRSEPAAERLFLAALAREVRGPWREGEPSHCDSNAWDRLPPIVRAVRA